MRSHQHIELLRTLHKNGHNIGRLLNILSEECSNAQGFPHLRLLVHLPEITMIALSKYEINAHDENESSPIAFERLIHQLEDTVDTSISLIEGYDSGGFDSSIPCGSIIQNLFSWYFLLFGILNNLSPVGPIEQQQPKLELKLDLGLDLEQLSNSLRNVQVQVARIDRLMRSLSELRKVHQDLGNQVIDLKDNISMHYYSPYPIPPDPEKTSGTEKGSKRKVKPKPDRDSS